MYSLIIIDDEIFSINHFKKLLDYKSLGFDLKETFINPQEAMEYIKKNKVDVIVTDIKMPVVSGIDIACYCYFNQPETKVILLSGYKDFEYAIQGIKYNVYSYINKPVTSAILTQTFSELYTVLANRRFRNQFLTDSENNALRNCFMKILSGNTNDIESDIKTLNDMGFEISLDSSLIAVLSISVNNAEDYNANVWKHRKEQLVSALEHLVNKDYQCCYSGLTFFHNEGFEVFFISKKGLSNDTFKQFLDAYVVSMHQTLLECLKMDTAIEDIFISKNISELERYYQTLESKKTNSDSTDKKQIMSNAARYINEHYHENVTLSTVAALSGFNPKYFSKLFNEYFKMGFADYLQKIRLEAAIKLLTDSDVKITSIPNKIGLSSFSTFAKNFKKYTGYSPLQYKDKFRKM